MTASGGEGLGSTFEIELPRVDTPGRSPGAGERGHNGIEAHFAGGRQCRCRQSLAILLKMQGHIIKTAHGAGEALAQIDTFRPDVMLIDIGLPDMDGYALVEQLTRLPAARAIRKIALTGYGQPEDRLRALDAGFDAHLVKPVDITILEQAIAGGS